MFDDLRLDWLCQRTCQLLNISSSIFVELIERNGGIFEDLIDRFFNVNLKFSSRTDALIFHIENSRRDVWQMIEIIDEDDDDDDDELWILNFNGPIDFQSELSVDFVRENARRSTGSAETIDRLRLINEFDGKIYEFALRSFDQSKLFVNFHRYESLVDLLSEKTILFFIRTDFDSIRSEETSMIDEQIHFGLIPPETSSFLMFFNEIFSSIFDRFSPLSCRNEFENFRNQIESTLRQIRGEFRLTLPSTTLNDENEEDFLENYEISLSDWEKSLEDELNNELSRRPIDSTPLAELDFWHERSIRISAILEQINKDEVRRIVQLLNEFESPSASAFLNLKSQFESFLYEASDNYKFLLTIERYLKTISNASNLLTITEILPNLMRGLKTIWTMSKHLNKDERFLPLLEKISGELVRRVRQTIDLRTLFSSSTSLNDGKEICFQAKTLLMKWKNEFEQTRKHLENDKRGFSTWNFDQHVLFDQNDSICQICDDLTFMLTNVNEFQQIFSTDFQLLTFKSNFVDEILEKLSELRQMFLQCQFDPFERENVSLWRTFQDEFQHRSSFIEKEAKIFIQTAFTNLRSAENALNILKKFQSFDRTNVFARDFVQQLVVILVQFGNEIDEIERIFHRHRLDPPIEKGFPPVAGAIRWSRFLFSRIRIPMEKLRSFDEHLSNEQRDKIRERFVELAMNLKQFETNLFDQWLKKSQTDLSKFFSENLFSIKTNEIHFVVSSIEHFRKVQSEILQLEKLNFHLPRSFVQMTFQWTKIERFDQRIRSIIDEFHRILSSLDTIEVSLLHFHVEKVRRTMNFGATRFSWGDVAIDQFIDQCENELIEFRSILNQIRKISSDIDEHLQTIRTSRLDSIVQDEILPCRTFFDLFDEKRREILSNLQRRYELIGPLLTKIEALLFGTNTGKHKTMRSFYVFWEKEIFRSLVELVVRNLCEFYSKIFGDSSALFMLNVAIRPTRLVYHPSLDELLNIIRRTAHDISKSPKYFRRWLNGTCLHAPTANSIDDEQQIDLTFLSDVQRHVDVIEALKPVRSYASTLITSLNRLLSQLANYNDLWKTDKQK